MHAVATKQAKKEDIQEKENRRPAKFKTDPKLKNLRLFDIPSYYERMKQGYVQNKNEDVNPDLPTTNQRTQRIKYYIQLLKMILKQYFYHWQKQKRI